MRHVNNLGPSKFRTGTENDKEHICYSNCNKKDRTFNRFLAVRKQTSAGEIIFSIVNLIDKSNKFEDSYYKIGNELREFNNDRVQFKHRIREFDQGDANRPRATETNGRNDNGTGKKPRRISKNPDFFQDNNAIKKKFFCKPYTNARI